MTGAAHALFLRGPFIIGCKANAYRYSAEPYARAISLLSSRMAYQAQAIGAGRHRTGPLPLHERWGHFDPRD